MSLLHFMIHNEENWEVKERRLFHHIKQNVSNWAFFFSSSGKTYEMHGSYVHIWHQMLRTRCWELMDHILCAMNMRSNVPGVYTVSHAYYF